MYELKTKLKWTEGEVLSLLDLLWMSQTNHTGQSGFSLQRVQHPFMSKRQSYTAKYFKRNRININELKIKFTQLNDSNLLLRTILEYDLLKEWIVHRARFRENHFETRAIIRINEILQKEQSKAYNLFHSPKQSFIHNSFWGDFYRSIFINIYKEKNNGN